MICRMEDIAKALGITVNTVSRALRDKNDISKELKEKVKAKAAEMGYVPDLNAKYMRTKKTKIIAIVYDYILNPYYSIVTEILQNRLSKEGYNLIIFTESNKEALFTEELARKILSRGVDGIISFLEPNENATQLIKKFGCYLMILGRDCSHNDIDSITTDDVTGGYLATKFLIDNGHKDILLFSTQHKISCAVQRIEGYKKALKEAGLKVNENNILYSVSGRHMTEEALKNNLKFSAVICFNDMMAFETIYTLGEKGKKVPQDVSVVGYDYIESHFITPVRLTTIDTDKVQTAQVAAEVLLTKLGDRKQKKFYKTHTPELVEGTTVSKLT